LSPFSNSVPSESVWEVTLHALLEEVLTATMVLQSAPLGCIQSYNRAARSLAIVAQQGFKPDFLAHFQDCNDETTTWCQALARCERVVIVDILSDAAFAPHRAAAEAAGYRAVQSTPLFGRGGEPLGVISTFFREPHQPSEHELRLTDLYARLTAELVENHLSEEALRASEARFRSYFEMGLIGMAETSPAKGILEVNDELCRILGYPRHEMLQKTWAEMTHPDDLAADMHQFNRVMAGEIEGYSLDKRWIRKDGRVIHSIMSAKCLRRVDGSVDYLVGLVLDTTERKHAEEALQKSRAELSHVARLTTMGELAATIAHEVNQPLGAIVNNANAALKIAAAEPKEQEDLGEVLSDIVKDAERASSIIARIRELLKRSTPGKEPLQVNDIVRDVLALAQRDLAGRGITVRIEFPENLPRVIGDRVQLQQVVLNLVMNGAEAMSAVPGPRRILTIGAERLELTGEPAVLITVSDLGRGFGALDPELLFERFYTTKPGGLGMGLRISRSIVVAHGGRLWAQANEHAGATFLFSLPVEMPRFCEYA
jgi:PAS domain S-box-containing protein